MSLDGDLDMSSTIAQDSNSPSKTGLEFGSFETRYQVLLETKSESDALESNDEQDLEESDGEEEAGQLQALEPDGNADVHTLSPSRSVRTITNPLTSRNFRTEGWKKLKKKFSKSTQQDLQEQHHFWLSVYGRLHHSPLSEPQTKRALDIGTGRGLWAIEFASKYRDCQVVAIDIQTYENWKMLNSTDRGGKRLFPNLEFQVQLLQPGTQWNFAEKFDFVHVRSLSYLVDHSVWFPSLLRNLNDGGWAEFNQWVIQVQSSNGYSAGRGAAVKTWNALVMEGATKLGKDVMAPLKFKSLLAKVGFEEIVQVRHDVPLNQWVPDPELKKLGEASKKNIIVALRPFTTSTLGALDWTIDQIDALLGEVRKDLDNTDFHCFVPVMTTFCRKPTLSAVERSGADLSADLSAASSTCQEDCTYTYAQASHIPIWSEP